MDPYTYKDRVNEHADGDDTTRTMMMTMSKAMVMMNNDAYEITDTIYENTYGTYKNT